MNAESYEHHDDHAIRFRQHEGGWTWEILVCGRLVDVAEHVWPSRWTARREALRSIERLQRAARKARWRSDPKHPWVRAALRTCCPLPACRAPRGRRCPLDQGVLVHWCRVAESGVDLTPDGHGRAVIRIGAKRTR